MGNKWRETGGSTWSSDFVRLVGLDRIAGSDVEVQNTETGEYGMLHVGHNQDVGDAIAKGQFYKKD